MVGDLLSTFSHARLRSSVSWRAYIHIDKKTHLSDHNKLLLSWTGSSLVSRTPTPHDTQVRQQPGADGPKGWCFVGSLTEDAKLKFAERVTLDYRLKEVEAICCKGHFRQEDSEQALRLLHSIIRDAWEREGLRVHLVSGEGASSSTTLILSQLSHGLTKNATSVSGFCSVHRKRKRAE